MEVISIQFVHKKCTQIYSILPNVYFMHTQKIHTGNVIDFDVFFLYTAVRGCVQKVYNRYKLEICDQCSCTFFALQPEEAYKKYTTDTNWKYVSNFDVQVSQYNQKKHTKSMQHSRNALTGIKGCEKKVHNR